VQAYRFALDPNASQLPLLHSHAGAARAAYNWAVARVSGNWKQRAAEESYGLAKDGLTPWQGWTLPALRKSFNAVKVHDPRFPAGGIRTRKRPAAPARRTPRRR
jgi:putative transposase